jgi:hypothetical protein
MTGFGPYGFEFKGPNLNPLLGYFENRNIWTWANPNQDFKAPIPLISNDTIFYKLDLNKHLIS